MFRMRAACLFLLLALPLAAKIEQIDLIATSHTDVGYTDQPSITRELQKRYLDIAIDACLRTAALPPGERFYWTAEATVSVLDWWNSASPERRAQFLQAVKSGQLDIAAMSCNNTPFMDAQEWATAVRWLPDDLWQRVSPRVAMQDDVNGMPRAGAMQLLNRGVKRLMMGINVDSGGRPFRAPDAFWWKMPDGRRMFVYMGEHYGVAFSYFEANPWLVGPSPRAGNGLLRPPRPGEAFRTDEQSVRAAHKLCVERLGKLEAAGYKLPRLVMSATNQWRYDNDPPFPQLAEFVAAWNRLKLAPALRFTTASTALADLEKLSGASLPVYEGEWTDFWANGTASAPREVAASRLAKRYLRAAQSEAWGPMTPAAKKRADEIVRDLILFDEHTWGSADSINLPDSLDTQGQFVEKSALAYMPMARAEFLLSMRMRSKLDAEGEGLYVVNTAERPVSGWVRFPKQTARREFQSLEDAASGKAVPVDWERVSDRVLPVLAPNRADAKPPEQADVARFWVENLGPASVLKLRFSDTPASAPTPAQRASVEVDDNGWPTSVSWPGMAKPLFLPGFGDFLAVEADAPRSVVASLAAGNSTDRSSLEEMPAAPKGAATAEKTAHSVVYTQALNHPRLKYLFRTLEVFNDQPRARLTVRLYRTSSVEPESFYINFPVPAEGVLPVLSSGGVPFVPFREQLGASCRDYFAVDGWAEYKTGSGDWLWVTKEAAMVTVGGPNTLARLKEAPQQPNRLMAMIFNNHWHTNFVADEHGAMEFQFELVWKQKIDDPAALAEALAAEPAVLINPAEKPDAMFERDLWRP
jgi:hypothetical protein